MANPSVEAFFDDETFTVSYVVMDPATHRCAVIDSVLDYDPAAGRTSHTSADAVIDFIRHEGLVVDWVLETHVHADHLSAAPYMKAAVGGVTAIGENVRAVQKVFGELFNAGAAFAADGSQFDHLFADGDTFRIGELEASVMHTPGHTPACVSYVVGDAVFVGDTLFMPDYGTARWTSRVGMPAALYHSIGGYSLPCHGDANLFCHDYYGGRTRRIRSRPPWTRERPVISTSRRERRENEFVAMREGRDPQLDMPRLILPSVQVNMRAGELPPPENNGTRYLKVPLNIF